MVILCPATLKMDIITGDIDNIDHNLSATSAKGSLQRTTITITQHPTYENPGLSQAILFNDKSYL